MSDGPLTFHCFCPSRHEHKSWWLSGDIVSSAHPSVGEAFWKLCLTGIVCPWRRDILMVEIEARAFSDAPSSLASLYELWLSHRLTRDTLRDCVDGDVPDRFFIVTPSAHAISSGRCGTSSRFATLTASSTILSTRLSRPRVKAALAKRLRGSMGCAGSDEYGWVRAGARTLWFCRNRGWMAKDLLPLGLAPPSLPEVMHARPAARPMGEQCQAAAKPTRVRDHVSAQVEAKTVVASGTTHRVNTWLPLWHPPRLVGVCVNVDFTKVPMQRLQGRSLWSRGCHQDVPGGAPNRPC